MRTLKAAAMVTPKRAFLKIAISLAHSMREHNLHAKPFATDPMPECHSSSLEWHLPFGKDR